MAHEIVGPGFVRKDERGSFLEIVNGFESRTAVWGRMRAGAVLGNHYHERTRVFFYVTRGAAQVETLHVGSGERDSFTLRENQGCYFEVNESHAVRFVEEGEFVMLKSLAYNPSDPDTFERPVESGP